ncbi:MAG TPA: hemerythrin domain-containing protein [Deltaproteobacteria bacterium]|nr:hemerythrin domain-containing protein [Deltaproteobacteria bacterium]HPR52660.1 hemerythrin domain-containing protein [Deltaproteobacteria bacterium]
MKPIGPLMWEHRLIEQLLSMFDKEIRMIGETGEVNPFFIDTAVDFIRTYADRTHHGKEEDILFVRLSEKDLAVEHAVIMNELIEEHKYGRETVRKLVEAKERYLTGENTEQDIVTHLKALSDFYPAHIEKEDKRFFYPCMEYFSTEEQGAMLQAFWDFDRKMIHEKYKRLVEELEGSKISWSPPGMNI